MCTAVYIGKDVSANGHTIIARSCDLTANKNTITSIMCYPRVENSPGRKIQAIESKISFDYPDTTYKCLCSPIVPVVKEGILTSIGLNEYGFVVSGTITAYGRPEIAAIDPFLEDGICEETLPDFLGKTCKTTKEAIDLIEKTVNEKGIFSANSLVVADQREAWMIELYSGHQWAAIKLPTDKISVYGNMFMIQTEYEMDNPQAFRHSKELFTMPKLAGLAVEKNGKMSLSETYSGPDRMTDYSNIRNYMGEVFFAKSIAKDYVSKKRYPLFFKPDKDKISLKDVFELYRFRYEGTDFCPETTGKDEVRLIGTEATFNAHAIEIIEDEKPQLSSIVWISFSSPEHSIYLPYSNLLTKVDSRYSRFEELRSKVENDEFPKDQDGMPYMYDEDIAQVCYKRLNLIADHNRKIYGKNIREFWSEKENRLIKEYPEIIKHASKLADDNLEDAIKYINEYSIKLQAETLEQAKSMFNQLIWYITGHIETLQRMFSFSNFEYKERTVLEPFKPNME